MNIAKTTVWTGHVRGSFYSWNCQLLVWLLSLTYRSLLWSCSGTIKADSSPSSPVWTSRVNIVQVANDRSVELHTSDPEAVWKNCKKTWSVCHRDENKLVENKRSHLTIWTNRRLLLAYSSADRGLRLINKCQTKDRKDQSRQTEYSCSHREGEIGWTGLWKKDKIGYCVLG